MSFDQLALILIGLFFIGKFLLIGTLIWFGLRLLGRIFAPRDNSVKININVTQPYQLTPQQASREDVDIPGLRPLRPVLDPTRPELELARREPPTLIGVIPSYAEIEAPTIDHVPEQPRRLLQR